MDYYNKLLVPLMLLRRGKPENADNMINSYIRNKLWYTVDISVRYWQLRDVFAQLSKDGPKFANYLDSSETIHLEDSYIRDTLTCQLIIYKRIPIILSKRDDNAHNAKELITLNTPKCRKLLNEFLLKCFKARDKFYINTFKGTIDVNRFGNCGGWLSVDQKTFKDVFIPDEQEMMIKNGITNFINNIDWLEDNHLPSHYGILLYGTPGCGRTSIIKAIINEFNVIPHTIVSLNQLPDIVFNGLPLMRTKTNQIHMVICEDVDCTLFNRQKGFKESDDNKKDDDDKLFKDKKVSLSEVLNSIDGLFAPHNTIFVFTTNHIEELDPALIRPGRMDLHLEIKPINEETLNKFTLRYFGKPIPDGMKCKEGELFSTLQMKILGGSTYDDIINYMKEESV